MTMQFDCENLAMEWDSHEEIRARLRDGKHLVGNKDTTKDATIFQCVSNVDVLPPDASPALRLWVENASDRQSPGTMS